MESIHSKFHEASINDPGYRNSCTDFPSIYVHNNIQQALVMVLMSWYQMGGGPGEI